MFSNFSKLKAEIVSIGVDEFEKALLEKASRGILEASEENTILGDFGIYYLEKGRLIKVLAHITGMDYKWLTKDFQAMNDFELGKYDSFSFIKKLHKYHFTKCITLESMFANNRGNKYFMSQKIDGTFSYNITRDNKVVYKSDSQKLSVCKNCLSVLSDITGKEFSEDVSNFKPDDVFNESVSKLNASEFNLDCASAPNIYARDWGDISKRAKENVGWVCEKCNVKPTRYDLHCHHIDSDKANNRVSNLMVLCRSCHEAEHPHMQE